LDFVKFYIVQLVKSAAARIRLADKEKEKLLSRLVSRIENSRDLFPDLKTMERVAELEEAASKLISIYRRLNKSHIDLEKISYQFLSDRDSIQSILRRFVQGNYRAAIVSRKRPKIVFDDTTFTIYELKEPEVTEQEEQIQQQPKEPRIDLNEFLKEEKEEIISIKKEEIESQIQIEEVPQAVEEDLEETKKSISPEEEINESLEIDNGIAQKSIDKKSKVKKDESEDLVLPLQFEEEKFESEEALVQKDELIHKSGETPFREIETTNDQLEEIQKEEIEEFLTQTSSEQEIESPDLNEGISNLSEAVQETADQHIEEKLDEEISVEKFEEKEEEFTEESLEEVENISNAFQTNQNELSGTLFLDFEKLILDNILRVDEFLGKALKNESTEEEILKLIDEAQRCLQLAKELHHDVISELIKVYLLSLVAIKDHKIFVDKNNSDLIRSTMIVLVSLIKGREIDLEPFMKKHNSLKAKLQQLQYEV
jgi:uncharacterized protein (DUF934 family)